MILKNKEGQVRLIWHLFLLVVPFLLVAYLLRYVPIRVQTGILIEQGLVRKIRFGSTFDRFDANVEPHYHFVCERCGSITDLELPVDDQLNNRVNTSTKFRARRHRIEFFGICDRCGNTEEP